MASNQSIAIVHAISRLLGWTYFVCWSVSFYPQFFINYNRKSVTGLAVDYFAINVLGFACYTISSLLFLVSPVVRDEYAKRHPQSPEPTVRWNDFAFAAHALFISSLIYSQFYFWGYERHVAQKISRTMLIIIAGIAVVLIITIALVGLDLSWKWIDVAYTLQTIKLFISIVKYLPQAVLNYRRKSTVGWSIQNILFDISGGFLSLVQLILDSSLQNDWSGLTGNPVKFFLSQISIIFDIVFILQHYVFYRKARKGKTPEQSVEAGEPIEYGIAGSSPSSKRKRVSVGEEEERLFGRRRFSGYNTMQDEEERLEASPHAGEGIEEGERRALLSSAYGEHVATGAGRAEEVGDGFK